MTTLEPLSIRVDHLGQQPSDESTVIEVNGTVEGPLANAHDLSVVAQQGPVIQACSVEPSGHDGVMRWSCDFKIDGFARRVVPLTIVASASHHVAVVRRDLTINDISNLDIQGGLDLPTTGTDLHTDVLTVMGWCLFEGSATSHVDVVINGALVGRARTFLERPDVAAAYSYRDAPVAGFQALVPIGDWSPNAALDVSAIATSLDGRRWYSTSNRVVRLVDPVDESDVAQTREIEEQRRKVLSRTRSSRPSGDGQRVAVITHDFQYGGGQLWLSEMLRQFRQVNQFDFDVIALTDGPMRQSFEGDEAFVHITSPPTVNSPSAHADRVTEWSVLLRALDVDAVMVNTIVLFQAVEAAHHLGLPVVWAIHESFPLPVYSHIVWGDWIHPFVQKRFEASPRLASALIFEAEQTADLFASYSSRDQRYVVDYGVDVAEIDAYRTGLDRTAARALHDWTDDDIVVAVVGVFEGRKAQAAIVAAFDELSSVHKRVHLVMVGSHNSLYSVAVTEQVQRMAHADRVRLVPVTPDIHFWYAIADLLVCASDVESLPRSILEAMAFELPVVSTDVFGVATLIDDGRTGWLTRTHDIQGLIATIDSVLRLPRNELLTVARAARDEVERRSGERSYGVVIADALMALIDDPNANLLPILTDRAAQRRTAQ